MKRLATIAAFTATAIACGPAMASLPPYDVSTTGSCAPGYPNELVSVGSVYVCYRDVRPEFQLHLDGTPCPAGWVNVGVGGDVRICVNV